MKFGPSGIRAYHSSPHDFDKFDLSKIGTGEGAQVYGHGLYFAENPAVSGQGGQYWNQFQNRFDWGEQTAANELKNAGFDRAKAAEQYRNITEQLISRGNVAPQTLEARAGIQRLLESDAPVGPRTYEVNINADPAHFLDWDKPLRGQTENIQKTLLDKSRNFQMGGDRPLGVFANEALRTPQSSAWLNEAGIPGIKYLDQGSRNATPILKTDKAGNVISSEYPPPSSNYVVFNPSIIDIMKKYGIAGAAPLGALAAQDAYQPQE